MHRGYACLRRRTWFHAVFTEDGDGACVSPDILLAMLQQHNQALPGVKALAAERLRMCRSRINQAVRDGCLEQYLAEFSAAVKKAQSTTFLRGEGARGRAGELRLVGCQSFQRLCGARREIRRARCGLEPSRGRLSWKRQWRENESRRSDLHPPPVSLSVHCAGGRDGGAPERTTDFAGAHAPRPG